MSKPAAPPEIVLLAALLPAGVDWWFVSVTEKYPKKPYVLFSDPFADETLTDPDLQRTLDTFTGSLFITYVDDTPGNVADTRQKVRSALSPSRRALYLSLSDARLTLKRSGPPSSIVEDDGEKPDENGRRPFFAVDEYTLTRTYI